MNQATPIISGKLKWAAFGAILAMFPILILFSLIYLDVVYRDIDIDRFLILAIVLQLIGCIIWGVPLLSCSTPGKNLNIPSSGWKLCATGVFIIAPFSLIPLFVPEVIHDIPSFALFKFLDWGYCEETMECFYFIVILIFLFIVINFFLAIGTTILGKQIKAFKRAKVAHIIFASLPILYFLIAFFPCIRHSYRKIIILLFAVIFLFIGVFLIISWWRAVADARKIEAEVLNHKGISTPPTSHVPTEKPATDVPPVLPTPSSITDAQRSLLMAMSNQELNNVISNPSLYSDTTFVDEAKKIIAKRQAWEVIKGYSDEQLLSIIHENIQRFNYEVLDAASMELFNREAPAFVNEINEMKTEELQGIIDNPDSYFDGYVQAAKAVIAQRQSTHD